MIIFICGFMGAGKTTLLGQFSTLKTIDLDQLILETYPNYEKLADLIEDKGFQAFRLIESLTLSAILKEAHHGPMIVALGGGAFNQETIHLIKGHPGAKVLWLKTPFQDCLERINHQISLRPLAKLSNKELNNLYAEREKWYQQADFTGHNSEQAVEIITNLVNSLS